MEKWVTATVISFMVTYASQNSRLMIRRYLLEHTINNNNQEMFYSSRETPFCGNNLHTNCRKEKCTTNFIRIR